MAVSYVLVVVGACVTGSLGTWAAYGKWSTRGLLVCLVTIAVIVSTWGLLDWMAQSPRESPLYAYLLLAIAPPAIIGSWQVHSRARHSTTAVAILGGAVLASTAALAVPFVAMIFP